MFHVVIYTSYTKIRETLQKQKQTEIGRFINHVARIPAQIWSFFALDVHYIQYFLYAMR